jgi:uncharacterized protein (TIGR02246 family)
MRCVVIALSVLLAIAGVALAGPKEDAEAAAAKFQEAVNAGNVDTIMASFAPDATLWGARSTAWLTTPDAIRSYYTDAVKVLRGTRLHDATAVALSDSVVRLNGILELTREVGGQTIKTDNAYSTVLVKQGDRWLIAATHVSPVPR